MLFKVMPDEYFETHSDDVDFLMQSVAHGKGSKLDLYKLLGKLDFDRRWTYQGSLTTPPFSEGVLWNVIEQQVPIR